MFLLTSYHKVTLARTATENSHFSSPTRQGPPLIYSSIFYVLLVTSADQADPPAQRGSYWIGCEDSTQRKKQKKQE